MHDVGRAIFVFDPGVTPTDPVTFTAASAGLALISLFAAYLAARRAARVQPTEVLKAD